jgi:hypothetical protein
MPKPAPLPWLLEEDNPSVRYFTLRDLLGKSEGSPEVRKSRKAIMAEGVVPKILARQNPDGSWAEPRKFYRDKYKGTVWQLIILANLGADGTDPRLGKACEFIFHRSQDKESGGFSVDYSLTANGGSRGYIIPCLTGNLVWSLIRLGRLDDLPVRRAIDHLAETLRADDGENEPAKGWPYDRIRMCYDRHSCHMGVGKTLKALAAIPPAKRTPAVSRAIDQAVEYFLKHHIYKKSHDLAKISKPGWTKFGFPLMYQDDVLEVLGIMAALKIRDKRLDEAVALVERKRAANGRWLLESTFNGRFWTNIEQKGKPSKWITLKALKVLTFYRG